MSNRKLFDGRRFGGMDILRVIITGLIFAIFVLPVIYALTVSVRPSSEVFGPFHLVPNEITVEPWMQFLADSGANFLNSVFIATGVSILTLIIAVPGAYAFSRQEFPGRKQLFYLVVLIMLVPGVMLVVPIVQIWRDIGLFNTVSGIWLALLIGEMPVAIWILRDNFQQLPPNAEEAAQIYGCTQFEAFIRVILPLATPAIIAVAFLAFLGAWNEFLFTNILTRSNGPTPVMVTLFSLLNADRATPWNYVMAGAFAVAIPPATFYLLSRRYLEDALSF